MDDWEEIKDQAKTLCSASYMQREKDRIHEILTRAQFRYEYWDKMEQAPYGEGKIILRKMAEKYHISTSTAHKYVYPKF